MERLKKQGIKMRRSEVREAVQELLKEIYKIKLN